MNLLQLYKHHKKSTALAYLAEFLYVIVLLYSINTFLVPTISAVTTTIDLIGQQINTEPTALLQNQDFTTAYTTIIKAILSFIVMATITWIFLNSLVWYELFKAEDRKINYKTLLHIHTMAIITFWPLAVIIIILATTISSLFIILFKILIFHAFTTRLTTKNYKKMFNSLHHGKKVITTISSIIMILVSVALPVALLQYQQLFLAFLSIIIISIPVLIVHKLNTLQWNPSKN